MSQSRRSHLLIAKLVKELARLEVPEQGKVFVLEHQGNSACLLIKDSLQLVIIVAAPATFPSSPADYGAVLALLSSQLDVSALESVPNPIHVVVVGGLPSAQWPRPLPLISNTLRRLLFFYQFSEIDRTWSPQPVLDDMDTYLRKHGITSLLRKADEIKVLLTDAGRGLPTRLPALEASPSTGMDEPASLEGGATDSEGDDSSLENHHAWVGTQEQLLASHQEATRLLAQEAQAQQLLASRGAVGSYAAIAFCVLMWGLETLWGGSDSLPVLVRMGAMQDELVIKGDWWRLLTYGYLHGGFEHLLSNCFGLLIYGAQTETLLGTSRFLVLLVISILGGGIAGLYLAESGSWIVGISGGVFGLLVSMLWLSRKGGYVSRVNRYGLFSYAVIMLVINLLGSLAPGVSMAGHIGGMIAAALLCLTGFITWKLPRPWETQQEPTSIRWAFHLMAAISVSASLGTLAIAMEEGHPWNLRQPDRLQLVSLNLLSDTVKPTTAPGNGANPQPSTPMQEDILLPIQLLAPVGTLSRHVVEFEAPWTQHVFGTPELDLITFAVMLKPLEEMVTPEMESALLEGVAQEFNRDMAASPVAESKRRKAQVKTFAGRNVVYIAAPSENTHQPRYVLVLGEYLVDMMFNVGGEDSEEKLEQVVDIVRSVSLNPELKKSDATPTAP